ncbi:hypothetical protein [Streptomyces sp. HPF1205]|uniref:hypothetical protein n=1 Tax=Streptomyces sp. HPF1205 TaxID=2873262 RepID=UPI001CECB710|nr:hypothetical protein [Streptomyces sp. HPF1205]
MTRNFRNGIHAAAFPIAWGFHEAGRPAGRRESGPADPDAIDWEQVADLYGALGRLGPSAVAAVNHAAAIGFAEGPRAGHQPLQTGRPLESVAVGFVFPEARLTVFNALDENGLDFGLPDPRCRRHSLR